MTSKRQVQSKKTCCAIIFFLGLQEWSSSIPPAQVGVEGSVRLLLTENSVLPVPSVTYCQVRNISFERFPRPWQAPSSSCQPDDVYCWTQASSKCCRDDRFWMNELKVIKMMMKIIFLLSEWYYASHPTKLLAIINIKTHGQQFEHRLTIILKQKVKQLKLGGAPHSILNIQLH